MRILFQGDSITDGNRYKSKETEWDKNHQIGHSYAYIVTGILSAAYPERGYEFMNRGVSGDRTDQLLARWQEDALALMKEYGVHPEAWGPFAEGNHGIFTHPVLTKIGDKYGKSAAQVALRWNIQRGVTVIPKSVHKDRMEQNINVWDFELSAEDMAEITKLDLGHSEIVNHDDPAFTKMLHGLKVHE